MKAYIACKICLVFILIRRYMSDSTVSDEDTNTKPYHFPILYIINFNCPFCRSFYPPSMPATFRIFFRHSARVKWLYWKRLYVLIPDTKLDIKDWCPLGSLRSSCVPFLIKFDYVIKCYFTILCKFQNAEVTLHRAEIPNTLFFI